MAKILLTEEGLKEIQDRLQYLYIVKRKEVADALQHARELGDLSENFEYKSAKDEQRHLEDEIEELESKLKNYEIIKKRDDNLIGLGSFVKLEYLDAEDEDERFMEVRILGTTEANFENGIISNESPLGKALLDHKVGDVVDFTLPFGVEKYKVLEVENK